MKRDHQELKVILTVKINIGDNRKGGEEDGGRKSSERERKRKRE